METKSATVANRGTTLRETKKDFIFCTVAAYSQVLRNSAASKRSNVLLLCTLPWTTISHGRPVDLYVCPLFVSVSLLVLYLK